MTAEGRVIREPIVWFKGFGDPPRLKDADNGTHTIELPATGAIFNLIKPRRSMLSHNEQQKRFPDDTGLRFQAEVADVQGGKVWTTGPYNGFMPPA